jgi:hypothetical protein
MPNMIHFAAKMIDVQAVRAARIPILSVDIELTAHPGIGWVADGMMG